MLFEVLNPLTFAITGSTRSSLSLSIRYLSLSRPPVSFSLKFCNRSFAFAAPPLCNELPKDLRQSSQVFVYCVNVRIHTNHSCHRRKYDLQRFKVPNLSLFYYK